MKMMLFNWGAALNLPVHLQEGVKFCSFPDYELENTLLFLVQIGISVNTIEYRDENGVFAIPKVKQILDDIEADY
ncbi:hypothetical protein [Bacteroides ovatus]|uniref:hypothetical protein n=1 Tax=Bacteroides ovatus TaxID=28116 RepID=UPI0020A7C8AE|nr:hypothetical protein [Bacteroides ovatus]